MKLPPDFVPGKSGVKNGSYGGFGQKMLEKMGWTEGEGLGRNRDGITEAIRVSQKNDTFGVNPFRSFVIKKRSLS